MKRFYSIVAVILSLAFFALTPVQSFATTSEELQEQQKKLEEEEKAAYGTEEGAPPIKAAMPKNAKPGSLKARVTFDGYGIYKQVRPWGCDGEWMDLHVNAHGILVIKQGNQVRKVVR